MDAPHKPSIASVMFGDYASLLCFLAPVILWGMCAAAALGVWPSEAGEAGFTLRFFLWSAIVVTVVFVPLLYRRIRSIRLLLRDGIAVPAKVLRVWFMMDRGRIDYEYTYEGQTYRGGMALTKSKRAAGLRQDQEITVLLHPANPSWSIVADVFG